MVTRACALALVLAIASGIGDGSGRATPGKAEIWIGGYELGSAPIALQVRLAWREQRLRGTSEIGVAAPPIRLPLRRASIRGGQVSLVLANGTRLEGRRSGGLIAGMALSGNSRGRFELRSVHPVAVGQLRPVVGAYRLVDGGLVSLFVEPFGTHLRMLDYRSGEMRQLAPISRDVFIGGPRLLAPWPVRVRVELVRGPGGGVVALRRNGMSARRIPLAVEAAAFRNGQVRLVGKLVRPARASALPAVVLVPGSERGTRDTLDLWGLFLASRGFAVLSHDKRGVGESSGRYQARPTEANLRALAHDALAGVEWLRRRKEIDGRRIGLSGGSQAGWTIVIAASQSSHVAFAAIQSGAAMSVGRQRAYSALTGSGSVVPPPSDARVRAALEGRPDSGFDPSAALDSLRMPVLWQLGAVDKRQYTPETVSRLQAVAARGDHDFTVRVYPGGAHSLRETRRGLISEEFRASRFVPRLFVDLAAWLGTRVPHR
jgi:dienelactone hydrolase